jgi:hypothetical protein
MWIFKSFPLRLHIISHGGFMAQSKSYGSSGLPGQMLPQLAKAFGVVKFRKFRK